MGSDSCLSMKGGRVMCKDSEVLMNKRVRALWQVSCLSLQCKKINERDRFQY
jgi:hypothetical protein